MAKTIKLDIVTPERITYSGEAKMVIARAEDGEVGILPGHAPLITILQVWPITLRREEEPDTLISIAGGFLEVNNDKVTILANSAELPEEIDINRAEAAKVRAEERLKKSRTEVDHSRARLALQRALIRLKVAENMKPRRGRPRNVKSEPDLQ